ncbi:MAG: LysR family transcriptional regulator [Bryobacteraceae bacterium]
MFDVNWNAVYGFWLVAEHGSFAAAARALPRGSVQALHRRIQKLESNESLDIKVFRSLGSKGVELTEAGRRLYELVDPVFRFFDPLSAELRKDDSGTVSIAMSDFASYNYADQLLKCFKGAFPKVSIRAQERNRAEVLDLVEHGHVDFGLCSPTRGRSFLRTAGNVAVRYELLAPRHHPLSRGIITWKDVLKEPLILIERNSFLRQAFEQLLRRRHLLPKLKIAAEVTTSPLAVKALEAGLGVALVPVGPRLAREIEGISRIEPPPGLPKVSLSVLYRGDRYMPKYVKACMGIATKVINDQGLPPNCLTAS